MLQIDRSRQIHGRRIEISTYAHENDAVIVEGRLTDHRYVETYYIGNAEARPPGVVHDLVVRMQVKGPNLKIEDIDMEMRTIPREECREILDALKRVIGLTISPGFTERTKAVVGGAKGCTHLVALLLAMAPAAVQGVWSAIAREPPNPDRYADAAVTFLENTCWVWRSGGEVMQALQNRLASADDPDENDVPHQV